MFGKIAKLSVIAAVCLSLTACGTIGGLLKSSEEKSANRSVSDTAPDSTANITKIPGSGKTGGDSKRSRFNQALENLKQTYHFNLTTDPLPSNAYGVKHSVADGVYDPKKKHTYQYKVKKDGADEEEWLIQASSDGNSYRKTNGAWTFEPGLTDQATLSLDIVVAAAALSSVQMKEDGSPNLVGTETINGEVCDHYHFDNRESVKSVVDVYISQASGNFTRFDLDDTNNKFRLLVDQIGEPVSVDTPQ